MTSTDLPLEEPTDRHESTIGAVTLKIPPFWPADPQIWFGQVEAQFSTRGISSEKTKFDHIVASLAPEYAQEVRDLVLSPPSSTPYATLKAQLIQLQSREGSNSCSTLKIWVIRNQHSSSVECSS